MSTLTESKVLAASTHHMNAQNVAPAAALKANVGATGKPKLSLHVRKPSAGGSKDKENQKSGVSIAPTNSVTPTNAAAAPSAAALPPKKRVGKSLKLKKASITQKPASATVPAPVSATVSNAKATASVAEVGDGVEGARRVASAH
jgi:hypothetical protein